MSRGTLGVVMLAALLVGCGAGSAPEAKPGFVVAAAAGKTTVGSARLAGSVSIASGSQHAVIQRMTGEQDFEANTSRVAMTSPLSQFEPTKDDLVITAIGIAGTSYQSISGLDLPGGKRWIRFDPADLNLQPDDFQSFGSGNPADGLQFLEGVRNVRPAGNDEIRGTATTRYDVTIDITRLMDLIAKGSKKLSPDFAKGLDALKDQVDLTRLPGAVWLDGEGRVRRFRYSISVPAEDEAMRVSTSLEFFDFGSPVSITAPPQDSTVPFSEVQDQWRAFLSDLQGSGSDPAV
jgi:hypothetical protein